MSDIKFSALNLVPIREVKLIKIQLMIYDFSSEIR